MLIEYPSAVVQTPGPTGAGGALPIQTVSTFIIPTAPSLVTVTVLSASGFVVGQNVYCYGANFRVEAIDLGASTVQLLPLAFSGDSAAGTAVPPGSIITAGTGGITPTILADLIATLTVAIANGGTGQTTQANALTALLGSSLIPIANGGTNAATVAAALTNLTIQKGVSGNMSGTPGSVTVSSVTLTANSVIVVSRRTVGGTTGDVSVPAANRTVNGASSSFVINSTGNETSNFDYIIIG